MTRNMLHEHRGAVGVLVLTGIVPCAIASALLCMPDWALTAIEVFAFAAGVASLVAWTPKQG